MYDGYCYKYDVFLFFQFFYGFVEVMRERMGIIVIRVIGYGYVGDGKFLLNYLFNKQIYFGYSVSEGLKVVIRI